MQSPPAALAATQIAPARAADASAWRQDIHSAFRLIAGANKAGATPMRAGIEIKMQPGWHTYWRYPGNSGVPPRFDFSGSENLAGAKVRYPAPHLYSDETGNTLGYKDSVIFPLAGDAAPAGQAGQAAASSLSMRSAKSCACRSRAAPR